LIVLIGLILFSGLISFFSVHVRTDPTVQEGFWQVNGQNVLTASVGEQVEAKIVVKAVEQYVGSIVVKAKKDIPLWLDRDYQLSTIPVDLRGGEEKEIRIAFIPDEPSSGNLRGYFIEIEFQATGNTWAMENTYPPRLRVTL